MPPQIPKPMKPRAKTNLYMSVITKCRKRSLRSGCNVVLPARSHRCSCLWPTHWPV